MDELSNGAKKFLSENPDYTEKVELEDLDKIRVPISSKIKQLWDSLKSDDPEYLYHYTNSSSLQEIIKTDKFYFTGSEYLNDSKELVYLKSIIDEILISETEILIDYNESVEYNDKPMSFREYFINEIQDAFNSFINDLANDTYVLSFSKDSNSLGMWMGYAKDDGYCLKFNYDQIKNFQNESYFKICTSTKDSYPEVPSSIGHSVIYSKEQQYSFVKGIVKILSEIKNITGGGRYIFPGNNKQYDILLNGLYMELFVFSCFCKDKSFEFENEYRIIQGIDPKTIGEFDYIKFRNSHGCFVPFLLVDFAIVDNLMPLEEIQIGPKLNIDIAEKGLKRLLSSIDKYKSIKVSKSNISLRY